MKGMSRKMWMKNIYIDEESEGGRKIEVKMKEMSVNEKVNSIYVQN